MKNVALFTVAVLFSASAAMAAPANPSRPKSYQISGTITDISPRTITIQKDKDKWELVRRPKGDMGAIKVGSKVTVEYRMVAVKVSESGEKAAAPAKK